MLPEFVNAIITLNTAGSYELYSGRTEEGGQTTVVIEAKNAEGYNSQYFKIKQVVVQPGQQAYIQKFDVPSLEIVHKLILMSIEEGYHDKSRRSNISLNEGTGEVNTENEHDNSYPTIPIVTAKSKPVNRIISETPIRATEVSSNTTHPTNGFNDAFAGSEYPGGIDEGLESFMGGGIKIANMRTANTNGQAASSHRNAIEGLLDSAF